MTGDLYSRVVGWLKILLPLGALALLSTLFLIARAPVPQSEIPFAEIEDIARDPRITAPAFAGVTEGGAAASLIATTIRPSETPDAFDITDFRVNLTTQEGETVEVSAALGAFDGPARSVALTGLARLVASSGYEMETAGLVADLGAGTIVTQGPLAVQAPFGEMTAGQLVVSDGGAVLDFTGGLRLLYRPGTEGTAP